MLSRPDFGGVRIEDSANADNWQHHSQFRPLKMRFLVVQNNAETPIGLVGDTILKNGGVLETTMPEFGGYLPESPEGYDGLVILGGEMSANDDLRCRHFLPLLDLIRCFEERDRPVIGLCLGAQLIARAYGANVYRHSHVEFGYMPVTRTEEGRNDPLAGRLLSEPVCLQFHEDTFDMPDRAVRLFAGAGCENQAFRLGSKIYGFQFHLEAPDFVARSWARLPEASEILNGQSAVEMIERELDEHYEDACQTAKTITEGWLELT